MVRRERTTYRYEEIASVLRERIRTGQYPVMKRLPSERALTGEFQVQRDTIRRALELLEGERRIFRDTTRGTFVSPRAVVPRREAARRGAGDGDDGSPAAAAAAAAPPATGGSILLGVRHAEGSSAPAAVMRGLARAIGPSGYPVLWHDAPAADSSVPSLEPLASRAVVGAVLWPETPAPVARLRALRDALPLVLVDRRVPGFESDFVGFDDFAGGKAVTRHLLRLGHRRIGFLSGEPQATTVQERLRGYAAALAAAGVALPPNGVMHQQGGTRLIPPATLDAYLDGGGCGAPLTAVVCANDLIAAHLIAHLRSRGRRVPGDVAITGFGNLLPDVLDAFGVTTVAQPFEEMGRIAGDILLARLAGSDRRGGGPREVELPMELIVRESCGGGGARPE